MASHVLAQPPAGIPENSRTAILGCLVEFSNLIRSVEMDLPPDQMAKSLGGNVHRFLSAYRDFLVAYDSIDVDAEQAICFAGRWCQGWLDAAWDVLGYISSNLRIYLNSAGHDVNSDGPIPESYIYGTTEFVRNRNSGLDYEEIDQKSINQLIAQVGVEIRRATVREGRRAQGTPGPQNRGGRRNQSADQPKVEVPESFEIALQLACDAFQPGELSKTDQGQLVLLWIRSQCHSYGQIRDHCWKNKWGCIPKESPLFNKQDGTDRVKTNIRRISEQLARSKKS